MGCNRIFEIINILFKKHRGMIITLGNLALFVISVIVGPYSGKDIPPLLQVRTVILIALIIFACLSPVLIMSTTKCLRRFIIDEEIENNNIELSKELSELASSLKMSTEKFDEFLNRNEKYFKVTEKHMDDCRKINTIVKKSYMINDVDEYYQQLKKARENADEKEVYLTNFSTKPYKRDNKYRDDYYSTNIDFVKNAKCNVYRIVTVHTREKLEFLQKLVDDAIESDSAKYNLAYLDIERFSNETGDTLPGIVGMDIIEDEVIIMDFKFARALKKNDVFENPLYIESERIADMCRKYYEAIWNEISNETLISKRKYQGYVLYNGPTRKVHEDIDNIWKEIESKIPVKS